MPRLALALPLCAAAIPAMAQSATDDSDLFPEDEQYLRFGNATTNIVISPFPQLDGGYTAVSPGSFGDGVDAMVPAVRLMILHTPAPRSRP